MKSEILNLVNEKDEIIGEVVRSDAHAKGLWRQRATVFVFNSKNELLIQQRTPNMSWPNLWAASASGHVLFNETYQQSAQRELKEEIKIECNLKSIGKIKTQNQAPSGKIENENHEIFICQSDGPFKIQKQELLQVKFESISNLKNQIKKNLQNFTPGFVKEFEFYLEKLKSEKEKS